MPETNLSLLMEQEFKYKIRSSVMEAVDGPGFITVQDMFMCI